MRKYINKNTGEHVEKLTDIYKDLSCITIGYFKFDFIRTTPLQTKAILEEIDRQYLEDQEYDIYKFVKILRFNQVAFRLSFHPLEKLSSAENIQIYAEVFLPMYKKLNDNNWLPKL